VTFQEILKYEEAFFALGKSPKSLAHGLCGRTYKINVDNKLLVFKMACVKNSLSILRDMENELKIYQFLKE